MLSPSRSCRDTGTIPSGSMTVHDSSSSRALRLVCGCNSRAVLAKIRGVVDGPRQVEVDRALDGEFLGEWRRGFDEFSDVIEAAGLEPREWFRANPGRLFSVATFSVRCGRKGCERKVDGNIDDLVELVRQSFAAGEHRVALTRDALTAARRSRRAAES